MKFFKKSTYIRYVIGVIQISRNYAPQIPFYSGFSENQKGTKTSFQAIFSK